MPRVPTLDSRRVGQAAPNLPGAGFNVPTGFSGDSPESRALAQNAQNISRGIANTLSGLAAIDAKEQAIADNTIALDRSQKLNNDYKLAAREIQQYHGEAVLQPGDDNPLNEIRKRISSRAAELRETLKTEGQRLQFDRASTNYLNSLDFDIKSHQARESQAMRANVIEDVKASSSEDYVNMADNPISRAIAISAFEETLQVDVDAGKLSKDDFNEQVEAHKKAAYKRAITMWTGKDRSDVAMSVLEEAKDLFSPEEATAFGSMIRKGQITEIETAVVEELMDRVRDGAMNIIQAKEEIDKLGEQFPDDDEFSSRARRRITKANKEWEADKKLVEADFLNTLQNAAFDVARTGGDPEAAAIQHVGGYQAWLRVPHKVRQHIIDMKSASSPGAVKRRREAELMMAEMTPEKYRMMSEQDLNLMRSRMPHKMAVKMTKEWNAAQGKNPGSASLNGINQAMQKLAPSIPFLEFLSGKKDSDLTDKEKQTKAAVLAGVSEIADRYADEHKRAPSAQEYKEMVQAYMENSVVVDGVPTPIPLLGDQSQKTASDIADGIDITSTVQRETEQLTDAYDRQISLLSAPPAGESAEERQARESRIQNLKVKRNNILSPLEVIQNQTPQHLSEGQREVIYAAAKLGRMDLIPPALKSALPHVGFKNGRLIALPSSQKSVWDRIQEKRNAVPRKSSLPKLVPDRIE